MDSEELDGLLKTVESRNCTDLELFNIKMYVIINSMGESRFNKLVENMINEESPIEKRINITKWPDGVHFYASIDNEYLKDDKGNLKWNTYKEAYEFAERVLRYKII